MNIPTINDLKTQIESDLRTELGITKAWYGKVFLRILALVQAGKLKLFYLFGGKVQKNIFVDTADPASQGGTLERFGNVKIGRNPYPAVAGVYTCQVTGQIGATIPKDTQYKSRSDSTSPDKLFTVEEEVVLAATTDEIIVRALEPGTDSALVIGDEIELTAPIEDVDSIAEVLSVDTTPVAAETTEQYREVVIQAFQLEPQGGAATDYRLWSLDVDGVRTSYPYTKNGEPYAVQVFVEALPEDSAPGQPAGVPPASMLDDVIEVIELDPDTTKPLYERGRRPIGVYNLEVLAVIPIPVTIRIYDLTDDSPEIISAIEEAIGDLLYTIRPYIAGADGSNQNDVLYTSQIISAVISALSNTVFFSNIQMVIDSVVVTSYTFARTPATYGNYPYLYDLEVLVTP
jgi:hypothetical protein